MISNLGVGGGCREKECRRGEERIGTVEFNEPAFAPTSQEWPSDPGDHTLRCSHAQVSPDFSSLASSVGYAGPHPSAPGYR